MTTQHEQDRDIRELQRRVEELEKSMSLAIDVIKAHTKSLSMVATILENN